MPPHSICQLLLERTPPRCEQVGVRHALKDLTRQPYNTYTMMQVCKPKFSGLPSKKHNAVVVHLSDNTAG